MRDIIRRIQRHRLSRYASTDETVVRRLRWVWPLAMIWLVYVVALSDHGFYRIWRLHREHARVKAELASVRAEIDRMEGENRDPTARRERAERALREGGGWARPGEIIYRIQGGADSLAQR